MLVVKVMADAGRLKLNEFYAIGYGLEEEFGDDFFEAGWSGDLIEWLLTEKLGYTAAQVTIEEPGSQFFQLTNSKGSAMQLLRELCERTGCILIFDYDGTVTHKYNPLYPLAQLPTTITTWNRINARNVQVNMAQRHSVSQVIITAEVADTDSRYTVSYPESPLNLGTVLHVDNVILGSAEDALLMAKFRFHQENAPLELVVSPVGIADWIRIPERHTVDWDLDGSNSLLNGRNFVTKGISHSISIEEDGSKSWSTNLRLLELIF
jgi:hypothetical protein